MLNLGLISLLFLVIVNTAIAVRVSPCSQVWVCVPNESERVGFSLATRG